MSNESQDFLGRALQSSLMRLVLLGALALLLQIPVGMISALGEERVATRNSAVAEIARTWGARQDITGPLLIVPYRLRKQQPNGPQLSEELHDAVFLPDDLKIDARVDVTSRARSIFSLPVFVANTTLSGRLPRIDLAVLGVDGVPQLDKAELVMRVSDVHAVEALPAIRWNGADRVFEPGREDLQQAGGLRVALPGLTIEGGEFSIALRARGSHGLYFMALGRQTRATITSAWPHPGFQGSWLPNAEKIGDRGFEASWSIPYVARGFPNAWNRGDFGDQHFQSARFGVDFVMPVDPYRMSERSLKYAALFIGLTFVAVWLFEVRSGVRTHPVQYLLEGAGMCLFYLLQLSLAEHFGFAAAYAIASVAVTAQIGLYTRAVLKAWPRALAIGGLVGALYGLLYVLLREEDYALLVGSTGLFVLLSAVMYLTRRVQWTTAAPPPPREPQYVDPEWRPL